MMRPLTIMLAIALFALGCTPDKKVSDRRAELVEVGGAAVKIVPNAGQLPFCLLFTASERGVVRQLTMPQWDGSVPCSAGTPIGNVVYKIPPEEGKVRIYVIFSDRRLDAAPMAIQVRDLALKNRNISAIDLRAPGTVAIEALDFSPALEAEGITVVGTPVGAGSAAPAAAPASATP